LTAQVQAALTDEENELWLSPVSVWEFLLLAERGRIGPEYGSSPPEWLVAAFHTKPMRDAPLNREVAILSRSIGVSHNDPADRFLAATAAVYDLTLVTADQHLLSGTGYRTLANR
jgi:PIN domain nuclease of toxin-antitoxin system